MKILFLLLVTVGLSWARHHNRTRTRSASLLLNDVSCNCGWRNSGRIVGGKETKPNEYPWMVRLSNGCGGSIISPWHVLTAAHCTSNKSPRSIQFTVGSHLQYGGNSKSQKTYSVSKIVVHSGWDWDTTKNDVSLLVSASQIEFNQFVGPVCMPNKKVYLEGSYVKVMGWGLTKGTGSANALREVDVKVTNLEQCKKLWAGWQEVSTTGTQLCAYEVRKDSCNGDSGGPLVYLDPETNKFTQAALVSFGDPDCGASPLPSVNTDVSAYIDWIKKSVSATKPGAAVCSKR